MQVWVQSLVHQRNVIPVNISRKTQSRALFLTVLLEFLVFSYFVSGGLGWQWTDDEESVSGWSFQRDDGHQQLPVQPGHRHHFAGQQGVQTESTKFSVQQLRVKHRACRGLEFHMVFSSWPLLMVCSRRATFRTGTPNSHIFCRDAWEETAKRESLTFDNMICSFILFWNPLNVVTVWN